MDYLFITTQELSALSEQPYIQRIAYVFGIRPYMDRATLMVGVKRKISYQSLAEALYVEPHQGIQSGSPSRQQIRRAVKGLERAGLVRVESIEKQLILKCLLADTNYSVQNKADTNPTQQADTKPNTINLFETDRYDNFSQNADTGQKQKADIPHNSKSLCVYVCDKFEKFWGDYPQKQNRAQCFEEFKKLNPSDELLSQMLVSLNAQIKNREELINTGMWVPKWKYHANWLSQQCWKEKLQVVTSQERQNAISKKAYAKQSSADIFADSFKDAEFEFEEDRQQQSYNVIPIRKQR